MVGLNAVFGDFVLVAVPESFELPLFVIGEQASHRLVNAFRELLCVVLAENNQRQRINQEGIVESLEQNHQHVETELNAQPILGLKIQTQHQRVQALINEC